MQQKMQREQFFDNMNCNFYYTVLNKNLMVKMIWETEILPINGFPKKKASNGLCKN